MPDSDNRECFLSKLMIFDKTVEQTDEWWLSPEEENEIREQLVREGKGGYEADKIVGQINKARFKKYKGEESKPEMEVRGTLGGWIYL